jgi:hypothetical protein
VEVWPHKTDLTCHFLLKGSETPVPSQESAGLTLEGIWAKKLPCEGWLRFLVGQKSPCNFEESHYVAARIFSPLVIYENVDIVHVFIEIYRIRY